MKGLRTLCKNFHQVESVWSLECVSCNNATEKLREKPETGLFIFIFVVSFRAGLSAQWRFDREELQQEGELGSSLGCGVITWGEVVAVKKSAAGGEGGRGRKPLPSRGSIGLLLHWASLLTIT